jgi:hypothetical protein
VVVSVVWAGGGVFASVVCVVGAEVPADGVAGAGVGVWDVGVEDWAFAAAREREIRAAKVRLVRERIRSLLRAAFLLVGRSSTCL